MMQPKLVLSAIAAGRVGLGALLLARPGIAGWFIGGETSTAAANVVTRVAGVRDVVIGVGTLRALWTEGEDATPWVVGSAVCDATDAAAHAVALDHLPRGRNLVTTAGAAATGVVQLAALAMSRRNKN